MALPWILQSPSLQTVFDSEQFWVVVHILVGAVACEHHTCYYGRRMVAGAFMVWSLQSVSLCESSIY